MFIGMPSIYNSEMNSESVRANLQPSTSAVIGAYTNEAYAGTGTLSQFTDAASVAIGDGEKISKKDFDTRKGKRDLNYTDDMTDNTANILIQDYDRRERNSEIMGKATWLQTAAGFGAGIGTSLVEPLNAAAGLATLGLGEAVVGVKTVGRFTQMFRNAKLAAGVTAAGVEGLAGAAVTEPFARYSADQLQEDYTWADTLKNVAGSAVFSSLMHVTGHGVGRAYDNVFKNKLELKGEAFDVAAEQLALGHDIDIETGLAPRVAENKIAAQRSVESLHAEKAEFEGRLGDAEASTSRALSHIDHLNRERGVVEYGIDREGLADGVSPYDVVSALHIVEQAKATTPEKTQSLLSFLRGKGGIREEAGELATIGLTAKKRPGLINNKTGLSHDEAALSAWEAGYFGTRKERPSIEELRGLIRDELAGKKTPKENLHLQQAEQFLHEADIDVDAHIANKQATKENVSQIDQEIAQTREAVTTPDKTAAMRDQIRQLDDDIARYPRDTTITNDAARGATNSVEGVSNVFEKDDGNYLDEILANNPETDIEKFIDKDIEERLAERPEPEFQDAFKEAIKKVDQQVKKYAKGIKAAADCLLWGV